jgi:hypothetical protein
MFEDVRLPDWACLRSPAGRQPLTPLAGPVMPAVPPIATEFCAP